MAYQNSASRSRRSVESFNHDGMEIARRRSHRRGLPVTQILLFLLFLFMFRIFLVMHMGQVAYGAKMATLSEGTAIEQLAAQAMVLDPVSKWVIAEARSAIH